MTCKHSLYLLMTLVLLTACCSQPSASLAITDNSSSEAAAPRQTAEEKMTRPILTNDRVVKGEYIVTLQPQQKNADSLLKKAFKKYQVKSTRHLTGDMYWIQLTEDPGIEVIQKIVHDHPQMQLVQPNFRYQAL